MRRLLTWLVGRWLRHNGWKSVNGVLVTHLGEDDR